MYDMYVYIFGSHVWPMPIWSVAIPRNTRWIAILSMQVPTILSFVIPILEEMMYHPARPYGHVSCAEEEEDNLIMSVDDDYVNQEPGLSFQDWNALKKKKDRKVNFIICW